MNAAVKVVDASIRLKKAHIKLIKHPETCLYGGVILMGESSVVDDPAQCPTAYTDGKNKRYGRVFMEKLSDEEVAGLVMHENLHVLMKHIPRHRDLMKENARLSNIAMDYAVNDIIYNIKDKNLCVLPKGALYDPMFSGWSVRRIYDYLKKEQDEGNGGGGAGSPNNANGGNERGEPLDQHDESMVDELSDEEAEALKREVDDAINQGGILAGKYGVKIPRAIKDILAPPVNWSELFQEFWTTHVRGADELTWRKFNKHRVADNYFLPSAINETIGEVIIAIDTSGSISIDDISEVASHVVDMCDTVTPERIRVLWWDTKVHGEQVFEGDYANMKSLLKPMGGGGTRASCVSEYIVQNNLNADCVIVFTDGHVENDINWQVPDPTLWLISSNGRESFAPPVGQVVKVNR